MYTIYPFTNLKRKRDPIWEAGIGRGKDELKSGLFSGEVTKKEGGNGSQGKWIIGRGWAGE